MVRENEIRSVESTEENRGETAPSRSRRGFLKKAAASILGMSGIAVGTEAASATETTGSSDATEISEQIQNTEPTQRGRVTEDSGLVRVTSTPSPSDITTRAANYNQIILEGVADHSTYTLWTTGHIYGTEYMDGNDHIYYDSNDYYSYTVYGAVNDRKPGSGHNEPGFWDEYYFHGYIDVSITSGVIDYSIYDW
jgi:hypothetical protein